MIQETFQSQTNQNSWSPTCICAHKLGQLVFYGWTVVHAPIWNQALVLVGISSAYSRTGLLKFFSPCIINLFLSTRPFPSAFKQAVIFPIKKKKNPKDLKVKQQQKTLNLYLPQATAPFLALLCNKAAWMDCLFTVSNANPPLFHSLLNHFNQVFVPNSP